VGSEVQPGQIYWLLVSTSTKASGGRKAEGPAQTGAVLLRTTKRNGNCRHTAGLLEKSLHCVIDLPNFVKSSTVGTSYGQLSSVSVFV
jgi:hypothetical protein